MAKEKGKKGTIAGLQLLLLKGLLDIWEPEWQIVLHTDGRSLYMGTGLSVPRLYINTAIFAEQLLSFFLEVWIFDACDAECLGAYMTGPWKNLRH